MMLSRFSERAASLEQRRGSFVAGGVRISPGSLSRMAALALVSLAAGAPAQTTNVTLQQALNGYSGAADNWIIAYSGADINKGSAVEVDMRANSDYGLLRFAIFQAEGGPVPNGATINSATLSLYKAYGPDAVFKASRLLKNWTETGSTWNTTGTGVAWSTPGAQGPGTDVLGAPDGQGSAPDSAANNCADGIGHEICWLNIDVTAGVQAFASGSAQNFGWLLQQVSSSDTYRYKDFNSKDETHYPQYRPKLTISYGAVHDPGPRAGQAGAGGPLSGLNADENGVFLDAKDVFQEVDSVSGGVAGEAGKGLGPAFNGNSCAVCHAQPDVGGTSPHPRLGQGERGDPQTPFGSLDRQPGREQRTPSFVHPDGPVREARFIRNPDGSLDGGVHGLFTIAGRVDAPQTCQLAQPDFDAEQARNNVIFRIPTPTFGLGLVENTTDQTLQ